MRRLVAAVALAASAVAMAAPPTARQAAEDETLVRTLVATRLAPLIAEWRDRSVGDATLRERLELALLEIRVADDSPAARLAEVGPARRSLVERAVAAGDPRRAGWALDLANDLLVASPSIDGRVATLAVGIATTDARDAWRASLDEADAALAAARTALADVPRGPLALPAARDFRRGWDGRLAALEAIAAGTRALLAGKPPDAIAIEVPAGAEWNDLALLAAIAGGPDALRPLASDSSRGPWIETAADCAIDLAAPDDRARQRLAERAAELARGRNLALAVLAADAAVRSAATDAPSRFATWSTLLDATPAGRRGPVRAEVFPRISALPPTGEPAAMEDLELAVRSLAEPLPPGFADAIEARTPSLDGSPSESARLLAFAHLRLLASRGSLAEAATLAERLATGLGDDPIAAAAAETLVLASAALAAASTDDATARAQREALSLATGRFPRHPRHDRWAIDLALARLDADESTAALAACRLVPDGAPLGPEARAIEAIALVRAGDAASIARAEAIVRESAGADAEVAARIALANALLLARAGRGDEARATADATVSDPSLPMHLRADAMRVALELGATPPAHAASGIIAAIPKSRIPLVAALRETASAGTIDRERLRTLLAALAGATASLTPDERLAVADATLAGGDAHAAARLASEVISASPRGSSASLAAMLVRARALRELGGDANLAEAFTLGRDVMRAAPQASPAWWDANALQLEILEASGRNRDQVIPWVNRLRAIDPQLGDEKTRTRIDAVARRGGS